MTLFVNAEELREVLGLTEKAWRIALPQLTKEGFPKPDPLFDNRYYFPAVRSWLDHRYDLSMSAPTQPDVKGALDEAAENRQRAGAKVAISTGRDARRHLARA